MRDEEDLKITAFRTFDKTKAWDNPVVHIPLEMAHLSLGKGDGAGVDDTNPQFYEQLCVKHDTIEPTFIPDEKPKTSSVDES